MGNFFLAPQPDESIHSLFCRYCAITAWGSGYAVQKRFFGKGWVKARNELPNNLLFLADKRKDVSYLGTSELLENHSLWPFYRCFIPAGRRNAVYQSMLTGHGGIQTRAGINASSMTKSGSLLYCSMCLEQDQKHGIPYLRRVHQIPEIQICPEHRCNLDKMQSIRQNVGRSSFGDITTLVNREKPKMISDELLIDVSKRMKAILAGTYSFDIDLAEYQAATKHLSRAELLELFRPYFRLYRNMSRQQREFDWLTPILKRPQHYFHPLKHILVTHFIESIQKQKPKYPILPFGPGPWNCINLGCKFFGQAVIANLESKLDRKSKRVIYFFKCSCGLIYTKSTDKFQCSTSVRPRVKVWGLEWEKRLRLLLRQKLSFRSIAKTLGTDAKTISRYARGSRSKSVKQVNTNQLTLKRKKWGSTLKKYNYNAVKQARLARPALYSWLYRNDRSWLLTKNQLSIRGPATYLKVNWAKRDQETASQVASIVDHLKDSKVTKRITKTLILSHLGKAHWLRKNYTGKMPLMTKAIELLSEDQNNYAKRKINTAFSELKRNHERPTKWKLIKHAGLRAKTIAQIDKYIQDICSASI